MDLDIAQYALGKNPYPQARGEQQLNFKTRSAFPHIFKPCHKTELQKMVQRLRYSSFRRQENYNKQLQVFIDRDRFQQNKSARMEYDRLVGSSVPPELQPYVNDRISHLVSNFSHLKQIMVN